MLTPEQQRQFRKDRASLYLRFGEQYRIWEEPDGTWCAERDGEQLSAETPFTLAIVLGDHMAYHNPTSTGGKRFADSGP